MTREELQPYLDSLTTDEQRTEVAAFVDSRILGKPIQRKSKQNGFTDEICGPMWRTDCTYSPIPPKPEPQLWHKGEHVKVGALIDMMEGSGPMVITSTDEDGFWAGGEYFRFASLTSESRWREVLPRSGAWLPCVVEDGE